MCFYSSSAFSLISFSSHLKMFKNSFYGASNLPTCWPGSRGRLLSFSLSAHLCVWAPPSFSCLSRLLHLCSCCASSVVSSLSCCRNSLSHSLTGLCCAQSLSHAQLCVTMKTAARQAPVREIFPARRLGWAAISAPGGLPDSGMEPVSPALPGRFSSTVPPGEP